MEYQKTMAREHDMSGGYDDVSAYRVCRYIVLRLDLDREWLYEFAKG